jgi:hypothetical protein
MAIKAIYSEKKEINSIISDLKAQSVGFDPCLVIYFSSSKFDLEKLNSQIKALYKESTVFGCSTSGEIVTGKMLKGSLVAMLFDKETVEDVKIEVLENLATSLPVPSAFHNFEAYYKSSMMELDMEKYVGVILIDGLSGAEERVMEKIGDLTDILFIGASAGDDLQFKATYVYANEKIYSNAAVLAVLKLKNGYDIIKTQSFVSSNKKLTATKVDEKTRTVHEFNNRPAVREYADKINVMHDKVAENFMKNPLGLIANGEPYVRSPQRLQNEDMIFYCNIKEGMELDVLESTDIIEDTTRAISDYKGASGLINFHCILRTLELEQNGQMEAYGKIFKDIPTIGFSTYGEEYIGHINQTSTMLAFR